MAQGSYEEQVANAKKRITEISAESAMIRRGSGEDAVWLDVREPSEWNLFRIPGAVHVPLGDIESKLRQAVPTAREVIVYCARGNRSALAAERMAEMGYDSVMSLQGGILAWAQSGGEIDDE
jgi:rhodanese-related sulfurtransferase